MTRLRFRDRFYNRKVGNAMTGPLGIILAGGGLAAGLAIGLPVLAAIGVGAAAWAARVAIAMPRGIDVDGIDPFMLADPWRSYVWKAKKSKRSFFDSVKRMKHGPLRDRLDDIAGRIETGVAECWTIAQSGQALAEARGRIDTTTIQNELTQINWNTAGGPPEPGSSRAATVAALEAQLDTAARLDKVIADTDDKLRLLDARLDEAVTRAIELSARGQRVDEIGSLLSDVDSVVHDMESLRVALDETDQMTGFESPAGSRPITGASAGTALPASPESTPLPGGPTTNTPELTEAQPDGIPQVPRQQQQQSQPQPERAAKPDAETSPPQPPPPTQQRPA